MSKYKLLMNMNASNGQLSNTAVCGSQRGASEATNTYSCSVATAQEKIKLLYPVDQQAKFFDLQAEADLLLKQLQALKQQRTEQPVSPI